jgi:phosphate transport system protein
MIRKSLDAFVTRDADLALSVLVSDDAVDSLRTACFSVARTLERLADHSTNIAETTLFYVKGIDVRHSSSPA